MVKTLAVLTYLFGGMHVDHMKMSLDSPELKKSTVMPIQYTCHGADLSPPLHWHHVPLDTRSLVLVMKDKDAPEGQRYLWALYNIPLNRNWVEAGAPLVRGERYAKNSWGKLAYQGPCPSHGMHHYEIKLYALKVRFYFHKEVSVPVLLRDMQHRIIATATLNVRYGNQIKTKAATQHSR